VPCLCLAAHHKLPRSTALPLRVKRVRKKRTKRIKSAAVRISAPRRDGLSAYEPDIGERPVSHPAPVASGIGLRPGGVVFSKLSKLLHQEDALSAPCLDTVILALRRRVLAGRRNAADRRNPSLRKSHYGLLHRTSGRQALMLSRWRAADAQVERMGARPNRAVVVKTALTCGY
jgi:hypothetical protein